MLWDNMNQLRITTWPNDLIPDLQQVISRLPVELVDDHLVGRTDWQFALVDVPSVLEVIALDTMDTEGIGTFAAQYGTMNIEKPFADLSSEALFERAGPSEPPTPVTDPAIILRALGELKEAYDDRESGRGESLDEFRFYVGRLRAMVANVRLLETPDTSPEKLTEAAGLLGFYLNPALAPFHAGVRMTDANDQPVHPYPGATLFEALALQVFNHLVRGIPYKECRNETCGRLFDHQHGRAEQGQYRKDAIYCSRNCARAQAQREYRRRAKES